MDLFTSAVLLHQWGLTKILTAPFAAFCDDNGNGAGCHTGLPTVNAGSNQVQDILKIAFAVLAALAVLFIVIAGLRFITAQGNPQEVSKAKSTIVYALVGLLVALLAEALVAFVLGKLN
ncbi:MAG TPA: hypothetical protein VFH99_03535 [Candidatus Saccharimonadales bacterium]|nr:hypothetical protein [Candidatus Saccharimonadales bacterium]